MSKTIKKGYRFRLYPTEQQEAQLRQHGGNARFVWNYCLDLNRKEYEKTGKFMFGIVLTNLLPELKEKYEFLKLSFSQSLQQTCRQFGKTLENFLEGKNGFPVYKKKNKEKDSFTIPQAFKINKNYVIIPKIGKVKWIKHQAIKGKVKFITIKQDGDHWYCSVNVEIKLKRKQQEANSENVVGIDVGLKTFATLSDNEVIENEKIYYRHEKKLKKAQRKLSRKVKGSKNREKQKKKISRIHRKIRNIRKDFQHKVSHHIITKYDGAIVENLNIAGMMKNHKLAKAVQDCAWFQFKTFLKYKALWNCKIFLAIDRFEPTSKCCSCCGWKNVNLILKDRIFRCEECKLEIDRDLNAAINILICGIRLLWGTQEASAISEKIWNAWGGQSHVEEPRTNSSKLLYECYLKSQG